MTDKTGTGQETRAELEGFSRVLEKIQDKWGTQECDAFLQELFMDSRGGSRQGFPMETGAEILFLQKFNKTVRAVPLAEKLQIPFAEAFKIVDNGDQLTNAPTSGTDVWSDPGSVQVTNTHRTKHRREQPSTYAPSHKTEKKSGGNQGFLILIIVASVLALAYRFLLPLFKGAGG